MKQVNNLKIYFSKKHNNYRLIDPEGKTIEEFETEEKAIEKAKTIKDYLAIAGYKNKNNRNKYMKEYYKKRQEEKGLKVKKYKKHTNETEEETKKRIKEYNRNAQQKFYKNHREKMKAKRRKRYLLSKMNKGC